LYFKAVLQGCTSRLYFKHNLQPGMVRAAGLAKVLQMFCFQLLHFFSRCLEWSNKGSQGIFTILPNKKTKPLESQQVIGTY
jgi:hypothetical protein